MRQLRWLFPIAVLLPCRLHAWDDTVRARVATLTINPAQVTVLHLRPEFESVIRMPEEITSVILGSPGYFKAEHNDGEPDYVYVKPITKQPAQSNLLIATKSGQHVTLTLLSDGVGTASSSAAIDFLIEYRNAHSFLVVSDAGLPVSQEASGARTAQAAQRATPVNSALGSSVTASAPSAFDVEYEQQARMNAPVWTKWEGKQIETSVGDVRQWSNETVVSYSIFNGSNQPVEVVPPQIQITGQRAGKKKKKEGQGILSDQLQVRDYRLSATRLEPGGRADGVVKFDRPNFKQSTERLFLQLAQADQVDRPILICLPFTPPIASDDR
jgi:hypothetical protein